MYSFSCQLHEYLSLGKPLPSDRQDLSLWLYVAYFLVEGHKNKCMTSPEENWTQQWLAASDGVLREHLCKEVTGV